jgi:hypothetical protein
VEQARIAVLTRENIIANGVQLDPREEKVSRFASVRVWRTQENKATIVCYVVSFWDKSRHNMLAIPECHKKWRFTRGRGVGAGG